MIIPRNSLQKYFLFNILLSIYDCQLKIPLTYFPISSINFSTPSNIFQYYIDQIVYANLEIGNPKQEIQIPLKFDTNDFYIVDYDIFTNDSKKFSGYKFYNSSNSKDHQMVEEDYLNGDYFDLASYDKDTFYFNNKQYSLEFYFPVYYGYCDSGGIGMQFDVQNNINEATKDRKKTFFGKLINLGLAKDYYWSIFYNSRELRKEDEGFLLLGCLPHEINYEDLGYYKKGSFNSNNLVSIKIFNNYQPEIKNILEIDSIYAYEGTNKSKIIEDFPSGNTDYKTYYLDYFSGGVRIPKSLQIFYHRVFEEYINSKECFNDTFKKNSYSYYFYYCKNDKNLLNKIKKVFPGIVLRSIDLNYNFTLEADDLFIEDNNFIFCLIYFTTSSNSKEFIMGKPFLKKYQFTFNYDKKTIMFYDILEQKEPDEEEIQEEEEIKEEEEIQEEEIKEEDEIQEEEEFKEEEDIEDGERTPPNKNNVSLVVVIIVVSVSIVVVVIIGYLIYKLYIKKRLERNLKLKEPANKYDYSLMENMEQT